MTTTSKTQRIAELNDLCRKAPGIAGKMFLTQGIAALPDDDRSAICEKVETFDSFTPDNDPHKEHGFGSFDHNGERIFWNIDYYDSACKFAPKTPLTRPKQRAFSRSCSRRNIDRSGGRPKGAAFPKGPSRISRNSSGFPVTRRDASR